MAKYAPLSPPIQGMPIGGGRQEVTAMPGYRDEWDILQESLENTGMFPFAPGLGDFASELGDLILYSSSGKNRTGIDRVNDLDRLAALPATWAGQAAKEFGGLLQMTPEQLVQLRRSIGSILNDDTNARSALWEGVKAAGRGYQKDPMSAAEDFGSPGMMGIAAPKLLSGMAKKALQSSDVPVKQPKLDIQQGMEAVGPEVPSQIMPADVTGKQLEAFHIPETVGWDVDSIPDDQWNKFVNTGDADAIKVEGDLPDPDDVDFEMPQTGKITVPDDIIKILDQADALGLSSSEQAAMEIFKTKDWETRWDWSDISSKDKQKLKNWIEGSDASAPSKPSDPSNFDILNTDKTLEDIQNNIYYDNVYADADIDKAIQDLNKALNKNPSEDMSVWLNDALNMFVAERRRRRAGGGESPSGESPDWAEANKDIIVGTPTPEDIDLFSRASQSASTGSNQDIQDAIDKLRERLRGASAGDDISDRLITMLNVYIKERAKRLSAGGWDVDFGGNKF